MLAKSGENRIQRPKVNQWSLSPVSLVVAFDVGCKNEKQNSDAENVSGSIHTPSTVLQLYQRVEEELRGRSYSPRSPGVPIKSPQF